MITNNSVILSEEEAKKFFEENKIEYNNDYYSAEKFGRKLKMHYYERMSKLKETKLTIKKNSISE